MLKFTQCLFTKRPIIFDESLRQRFVERLNNPQRTTHSRFSVMKVPENATNSAVLVPFLTINGEAKVILTERSHLLNSHRGQICFPGGKIQRGESIEQAALRECSEEIGLDPHCVTIWGRVRPMFTANLTGIVTPVVGVVQNVDIKKLNAQPDEVRSIFAVSVEEICSSCRYTHFRRGKFDFILPVFTTKKFTPVWSSCSFPHEYRIWGLSAGLLHLVLLDLFPERYSAKVDILNPKL
ncbi:hypothetical protein AB6A40_008861 [Gnathostoma spinigerum]|uniref:Nudix hydrolase domain-containing protein n=1 Tax=Gnathostoma spinigerum TaxID=75299 RepID=A0ABD6ESP1_9BILA